MALTCSEYREDFFVATKVAGPSGEMTWIRGGPPSVNRKNISAAIDASLQRLQTDYIDLYQIHWPDRYLTCSDLSFQPILRSLKNGSFHPKQRTLPYPFLGPKNARVGLTAYRNHKRIARINVVWSHRALILTDPYHGAVIMSSSWLLGLLWENRIRWFRVKGLLRIMVSAVRWSIWL